MIREPSNSAVWRTISQVRASTELKPCPFCNSRKVELHSHGGWWYVDCNECAASGPFKFDGKAKAVRMWQEAPRAVHQSGESP